MSSYYKTKTAAQRKAWGRKMAAAKAAKSSTLSGMGGYRGSRAARSYSRPRQLSGRGGYYDSRFVKTMNKAVPKGSFKSAGSMVGGPLGGLLGRGLSSILGFGDYEVKSNSITAELSEGESPARMHSGTSTLKVRHREYITDIISSQLLIPSAFNHSQLTRG